MHLCPESAWRREQPRESRSEIEIADLRLNDSNNVGSEYEPIPPQVIGRDRRELLHVSCESCAEGPPEIGISGHKRLRVYERALRR